MASLARMMRPLMQCVGMLCPLLLDALRFLWLCLRRPTALAAENLFLRQQLALYQEHNVKPRRASHTTRFSLVWLSQWFDWHPALVVVQGETFKRWRRQGCRLFWHCTPSPGRPPLPVELQGLIRQMACDNCTWGQQRIANELLLKLGLRVSPRTIRKYMPTRLDRAPGPRVPSPRWRTFVRNHARALIVHSLSADHLTRGVQGLARIKWRLPRWWGSSVASRGQESVPRHVVFLWLLIETRSVPAAWSPGIWEEISEDDRSPPEMKLPRHHVPSTTARATPMETLDVCQAIAVGCGWHRARASSRSAEPLYTRAPQAILVRRAA